MATSAMDREVPIAIAVVGAGEFGTTFLAQARRIAGLSVKLVCDRDPERAEAALRQAGHAAEAIRRCSNRAAAITAVEEGSVAVVEDLSLLSDLPLNVVLEATGDPEAAARTAEHSLVCGYHVALVTKEAEVVVGPVLAHKARAAGLILTPVDGDQPSLLIGLVNRAEMLGLPVIAAGKSTESDYVFDPIARTLSCWGETVPAAAYHRLFSGDGDLKAMLTEREHPSLPRATTPDLCEMAIVANHCGLTPDLPQLHAPVARTLELPRLFCPVGDGGLLRRQGVVDVFACLRRPDELSFAGGVFVTVRAPDRSTGRLLASKGIPSSGDGRYLLLHNPVHLLGVEAVASVLAAAREGRSTGAPHPRQHVDLVGRASRDIAPGETLTLGARHAIGALEPMLLPACALGAENPVPYYLAAGRKVIRPVARGRILTLGDIDGHGPSVLQRLRQEQDSILLSEQL